MVPDVIPLRAIIFQCLLLLVTIAIEASVLFGRLRTGEAQLISPKQSVQYAISINLLATVLGWFVIFSFFGLERQLPYDMVKPLEDALLNFIFFNQLSSQSLSLLIVIGFVTFFASFSVKQVGLWGLQWLLQSEFPRLPKTTELESERTSIIRNLRQEPRQDQPNLSAILIANAWSHSAVLAILLLFTAFSSR